MTPPTPVLLLRHFDRPLDDTRQGAGLLPRGRDRAAALCSDAAASAFLDRGGAVVVHVSPFLRCMESVAPLARSLGAAVVVDARLGEHPVEAPLDLSAARSDAALHFRGLRVELSLSGAPRDAAHETAGQLRHRCEAYVRDRLAPGGAARAAVVVCSHQSTLRVLSGLLGCAGDFARMGDMVRLDLVESTM